MNGSGPSNHGESVSQPIAGAPLSAPSTITQSSTMNPNKTSLKRHPSQTDSSDSEEDETRTTQPKPNDSNSTGTDGAPAPSSSAGAGRELTRRERRALKSKHRKINPKHPEFELTYDMMLGIRTVVGNNPTGHTLTPAQSTTSGPTSTSDPDVAARRKKDQEASQTQKLAFPGRGSSLTPAHAMRDFKFKDYSADLFRKIRARFKIDPTEYLLSVCGNFQYLEFISNSKSGQFFFYSHDRQYMIKTISGAECKFLRQILPSYLEHIESNPQTLLTRFYGMHRIRPHKKREVHFLIMGSVFYTSKFVHTVFDLKGSKQGRNATEKEKKSGAAVYKDNDFLDMHIQIKLGAERARQLNEQIARDVAWLSRLNIMDYSLLLGIHYKDRVGDVYGPHDQTSNGVKSVPTSPLGPTGASSNVAGARGEGIGGTGTGATAGSELELVRGTSENPNNVTIDDNAGIYTQLHPKRGVSGHETSHLEPHSVNGVGIGLPHEENGVMTPMAQRYPHHSNLTHLTSHSPSSRTYPPSSTTNTPVPAALALPTIASNVTLTLPRPVTETERESSDDMPPMVQFHYDESSEIHNDNVADSSDSDSDSSSNPPSGPVTPRRQIGSGGVPAQHTPASTGGGANGGFSSRTWTLPAGAAALPNGVGPRTVRSHSVLPISNYTGAGGPTSPTTAAMKQAEAAQRTKKELAAAAKLDAIAKQTAYGLPKKYNTVSKPGDIAFPFEFDENGNAVQATVPPTLHSQPSSPHHASIVTTAAMSNSPVGNGPVLHLSPRKTATETTPILEGEIGVIPVPQSFDPLPPSSSSSSQATSPKSLRSANLTTPQQPARSMSVFVSPTSRDTTGTNSSIIQQRDRGISTHNDAIGVRSILQSPVHNPHRFDEVATDPSTGANGASSSSDGSPIKPIPVMIEEQPAIAPITNAHVHERDEQKSGGVMNQSGELPHDPNVLDLFGTDGGCAGQNEDGTPNNEIYFMGIIDILQEWNLSKKSERLAKVYLLNNRSNEISAAPPDEYAERFKAFIKAACMESLGPNQEQK